MNSLTKLLAVLVILTVPALMISSCSKSAGNYEKLILTEAENGGVWGVTPVRINEETGDIILPPLINAPIYEITAFNHVKVIKFGSVPSASKEDIESDILSADGVLENIPRSCLLSIFHESLNIKGPTAILAEVSIARMKTAPLNKKIFGETTINDEYLNESTRVWFLGYTQTAKYEGEKDYYTIKVACFEDLNYFDNLVERD